jgi:hypothetical protein
VDIQNKPVLLPEIIRQNSAKNLDEICSSVDLLLVSLDKLTKIIEPVFVSYPETANLLLRYFSSVDDNVVRIKNNAIRMKQTLKSIKPEDKIG